MITMKNTIQTEMEQLAEYYKNWYGKLGIKSGSLQTVLVSELIHLARDHGYIAVAEYVVENVPPFGRSGRLDLVWINRDTGDIAYAFEIDRGIKEKSIQKLLHVRRNFPNAKIYIVSCGTKLSNFSLIKQKYLSYTACDIKHIDVTDRTLSELI